MEGLSLCPGEVLDDCLILSGFYLFYLSTEGSEEEEMLHIHHGRADFLFVCVFPILASAGLLAEGAC